jgi:hypothetical protein
MTDRNYSLNRHIVLDNRIGRLVEPHMAVAGLQKGKVLLLRGHSMTPSELGLPTVDCWAGCNHDRY